MRNSAHGSTISARKKRETVLTSCGVPSHITCNHTPPGTHPRYYTYARKKKAQEKIKKTSTEREKEEEERKENTKTREIRPGKEVKEEQSKDARKIKGEHDRKTYRENDKKKQKRSKHVLKAQAESRGQGCFFAGTTSRMISPADGST